MDYRIRYPDPAIKVNDTVKIDLATGKIVDFIQFDTGVIAMATGGRNMGRVGVITHRERHDGGFNIVHIKDAIDNEFATRESNVFVIGREKPWISLPKGKGVKVRIGRGSSVDKVLLTSCSFPSPRREIAAERTPSPSKRTIYWTGAGRILNIVTRILGPRCQGVEVGHVPKSHWCQCSINECELGVSTSVALIKEFSMTPIVPSLCVVYISLYSQLHGDLWYDI